MEGWGTVITNLSISQSRSALDSVIVVVVVVVVVFLVFTVQFSHPLR